VAASKFPRIANDENQASGGKFMNSKVVSVICTGLLAGMFLSVGPSFAATAWQRHHPRRVEVNSRLRLQNRRISTGLRDHQLTASQAQQLRTEDRSIHYQERVDAAGHDTHITKAEKQQLNREENGVSRQIHTDRVEGN
jgi:hypothetical protein